MKLGALAAAVGGEATGPEDVEITHLAEWERAGPGALVMVREARHLARAEASGASALLLPASVPSARLPSIRTADVRLAFARAIALLHPTLREPEGIHPTAIIGERVQLGASVAVGPHTTVGDDAVLSDRVVIHAGCVIGRGVQIGADSVLYAHVTIYDGCRVGERVLLHSGVVIGADGFGFAYEEGRPVKIPHVGTVVVEDDVEIGANSCVDRATLGETRIGRGTKIDNLVQIGHNVSIGAYCAIAGQVGIAGSATVGSHVLLGGQAGVVDHASVGDQVTVLARAVVTKDIPKDSGVWSGDPARPHREQLRAQALARRRGAPPT